MLLLDTHVWIWSMQGEARRIGRRARQLLARAESQEAIRISPVSIFELTALHTSGRLRLTRSPERWIAESLGAAGVRQTPLSLAMAIDAGSISRDALGDPMDRLLVATARQLDAIFLTGDGRILDYARKTGNVHVSDASR